MRNNTTRMVSSSKNERGGERERERDRERERERGVVGEIGREGGYN